MPGLRNQRARMPMNVRLAIKIVEGSFAFKSGRDLGVFKLKHGAGCGSNRGRPCNCGQGVKIRSGGRVISINPDGVVKVTASSLIIEAEVVGVLESEIKRI